MNRRHRKLKAALAEAMELVQSLHIHKATFVGLVGQGEYDSKVKAAQVAALACSHAICEHEMLYGKPGANWFACSSQDDVIRPAILAKREAEALRSLAASAGLRELVFRELVRRMEYVASGIPVHRDHANYDTRVMHYADRFVEHAGSVRAALDELT